MTKKTDLEANLTREEYNQTFDVCMSEEEYEELCRKLIGEDDYDTIIELTLVNRKTGEAYRFTKENTVDLNIDGKDRIHVAVKNGITFDGIVLKAETFGNQFRIEGKLTEGAE